MADKGTLEAINKLRAARPRQLLDIIDALVCTQQNFTTTREGLVEGLRFLVEDFRRQADLVMDSGARGKGAEATALRATASSLSLLADAVEKVSLDGAGEVLPQPSRGGPKLPAEWCGKTEEHPSHLYELPMPEGGNPLERGPLRRECLGRRATDLSGLKALVVDRAAKHAELDAFGVPDFRGKGDLADPRITGEPIFTGGPMGTFTFADPAMPHFVAAAPPEGTQADTDVAGDLGSTGARRDGELEAYLSGATNVMPPIRNDREGEPGVMTMNSGAVLKLTEAESAAFVTLRVNTPDQREAAAAMFADPKPLPDAAPPMPGGVLSWADVRKAPAGEIPAHLSFSQGGTLDECGMQYRLDRLEPGVVARPHWANVGGTALHAAVEWFERQMATKAPGNAEYARSRVEIAGGFAAIWAKHFAEALTAQVLKTPTVPPAHWKAGGRGQSEGWTWWQVEGEEMLKRYLEPRLTDTSRTIAGTLDGAPMIELEGVLDVEGVAYKVVIDQVWRGEDFGLEAGSLVIDDLKSGAYAPKGSYQLGGYAWYLRNEVGHAGKIYGRFWDARTGKYGDPVDLLELHPWDEIVVRVHGQAAKKAGGIFTPAPDWSRCGGCAVKHACPAALTRD